MTTPTGVVIVLPLPNAIRRLRRPPEDRNDVTPTATSWAYNVTPIGAGHAPIAAKTALGPSSQLYRPWIGRSTVLRSLSTGTSRVHPRQGSQRLTVTSHRHTCVAVAVAIGVLVAGGCGSGAHTNGLEKKSATQVQQAAAGALKAAKSVHLTGTGRSDNTPVRLDLRIQGQASAGTIGLAAGTQYEITAIANDVYIKADRRGWQALGAPAAMQNLAGRWVKVPDHRNLEGFSLDALAAQLIKPDSPVEPKVDQTRLDGKKVVVISQQNGSKLYVANTGPAYPLRGDYKGPDAGRLDFTEYGVDFHITAPSYAVNAPTDTHTATAPPATTPAPTTSGPMTGQELLWLQAVEQLLPKMDKVFDTAPTNLTSSALASLAYQLRGCSRELSRIGSPTARLQPVSVLVHQACQEYDKGAQCFEDAARMGIPSSSADEQAFERKVDCGFAASEKGGEPLTQALNKADEIKAAAH